MPPRPLGVSYQPGEPAAAESRAAGLGPVQNAVQFLSLQLPRTQARRAPSPLAFLQAMRSGAGGDAGLRLLQRLRETGFGRPISPQPGAPQEAFGEGLVTTPREGMAGVADMAEITRPRPGVISAAPSPLAEYPGLEPPSGESWPSFVMGASGSLSDDELIAMLPAFERAGGPGAISPLRDKYFWEGQGSQAPLLL